MIYMTKKQALDEFKEHYIPSLDKIYGKDDVTARREAWNNYTDSLRADKKITNWQYENWTGPY